MAKKKGKGRGWWGDPGGHARAAKSGGKTKKASKKALGELESLYQKGAKGIRTGAKGWATRRRKG